MKTCIHGHDPADRTPSGGCRPCQRRASKAYAERKRIGASLPIPETCRRGHLREGNWMATNTCRICANQRGKVWKARQRALQTRPKPETRVCGHAWEERTKKGDCAVCARNRTRAYMDKKRGGPPRQIDPEYFPCGHPRSEGRKSNPSNCGTCHREKQKARYHADPVTHRQKALAWQAANRDKANARGRAFRERNPGYAAARNYAPDAETRGWLEIIRQDPCSYCGGPSTAVDHIKPISAGGENHWSNFAPTCLSCNSSKSNRPLLAWLLWRAA